MVDDDLEARAKALHRQWAWHTIRRYVPELKRGETPDEAHERRWAEMAPKVRAEFVELARQSR